MNECVTSGTLSGFRADYRYFPAGFLAGEQVGARPGDKMEPGPRRAPTF